MKTVFENHFAFVIVWPLGSEKTVVDACYVGYVFSVCFVMLSVTNKKTHDNLGTKWIDGDPGRSLFGVDVIFF